MAFSRDELYMLINNKAKKKEFDYKFIDHMLKYYKIGLIEQTSKPLDPDFGMNYKMDYCVFSELLQKCIKDYNDDKKVEFLDYFDCLFKKRLKNPYDCKYKERIRERHLRQLKKAADKLGIDLNKLNNADVDAICKSLKITEKKFYEILQHMHVTIVISIDEYLEEKKADIPDCTILNLEYAFEASDEIFEFDAYIKKNSSKSEYRVMKLFLTNAIIDTFSDNIERYLHIIDPDYYNFLKQSKLSANDKTIALYISCSKAYISKIRKIYREKIKKFKENFKTG